MCVCVCVNFDFIEFGGMTQRKFWYGLWYVTLHTLQWLDSELHYFSIFTENKKNEHLIFCEYYGR